MRTKYIIISPVLLIFILLIVFVWKAAPIEFFSYGYFNGSTDKREIALAFDDGPDWGEEAFLAALNRAGIRATFFWTWQKIEMLDAENPARFAAILRLLSEGEHEVGVHGSECRIQGNLVSRVFGFFAPEDLAELRKNFTELLHKEPRLYRPHGVRLGRELYTEIRDSGLKLILGSTSYQIGQTDPAPSYFKALREAGPGTIIAGHDSKDCFPGYGLAPQLAKITPDIEKILATREFSAVTVSEIIGLE